MATKGFNPLAFAFNNAGAIGDGLSTASGVTRAFGALSSSVLAKGVQEEKDKTNSMIADVHASRIEKNMRARLEATRVQNAAGGNSMSGSAVFAMADNARIAEERRQDALLGTKVNSTRQNAALPTVGNAILGFGNELLGVIGDRADRDFEGDL